ncbi:MAG: hypothetical protein ABUL77_02170 [Bacteroidota bacterium]
MSIFEYDTSFLMRPRARAAIGAALVAVGAFAGGSELRAQQPPPQQQPPRADVFPAPGASQGDLPAASVPSVSVPDQPSGAYGPPLAADPNTGPDFGYAGQTYSYYGAHPLLDTYGGGWCFMMGGHAHVWAPWSPYFTVVGPWYYWHGPYDPFFWAYWPYYSFYYRSYYPHYYGGGRFYRGGGYRVAPAIRNVPPSAWRGSGPDRTAPTVRGMPPSQMYRPSPGSPGGGQPFRGAPPSAGHPFAPAPGQARPPFPSRTGPSYAPGPRPSFSPGPRPSFSPGPRGGGNFGGGAPSRGGGRR